MNLNHKSMGPVERDGWQMRRPADPVEWAEKNFRLTTAYARPGRLRLYEWQKEVVRAVTRYDVVMICGPVQTGKSLLSEIMLAWMIDNDPMNAMIVYENKAKVKEVFGERLREMVREVPVIREQWSGDEDALTQEKITLRKLIIRIASAGTRGDIATHSAGYVYGSEVCKWPEKRWDQVRMLFGRQEAYKATGRGHAVLESSPDQEGDKLHREMYKRGVLNLEPYVPCPNCGKWQRWSDVNIKETPNAEGEFDHNSERIRADGAARYECPHCHREIRESDRIPMMRKVVWAAEGEEIIDGKIKLRHKRRHVSFRWNRLVNESYTFAECLARFFESRASIDPTSLKTYQNEDMARFTRQSSRAYSTSWLMGKREEYEQYGETARYPNDVLVLTCGIDAQDAGFYYVVRGWGEGVESWLVKHDWIDMDIATAKDRDRLYAAIQSELVQALPPRADGTVLPIRWGFCDRGGHRSKDVDYICSRFAWLHASIGSVDKKAPLVTRSKTANHWRIHTENLSKQVESWSDTDIWNLPIDVSDDYCGQFVRHWWEERRDTYGNVKTVWVHGGKDHYRDCEILNVASAIHLNLETALHDAGTIAKVKGTAPPKPPREVDSEGREMRGKPVHARQNYFGARYQGW